MGVSVSLESVCSVIYTAELTLQASAMKLNLHFLLLLTFMLSLVSAATQRTVCAICVDRRKVKRRQEMLTRRPTYFTRPNSFTGMTFQEFAARYTGGGRLPG